MEKQHIILQIYTICWVFTTYPSFYLRSFHRVVWGRKPCLEKTPISPSKCCEHSLHLVCSILAFSWVFQAYLSSFTLSLLFSLATSFRRIFSAITRRVVKCYASLPLLQIRSYWEHFLNFIRVHWNFKLPSFALLEFWNYVDTVMW